VALKGDEATEQAFYDLSEGFKILHFSTHAIVDENDPNNSYLVLSNPSNPANDGFLYVKELSKMNLNADLVVLAACNTGNVNITNECGINSIGSAFLEAGCASVVMSLWSAYDESTSFLMENFYYFLSKGASKDEALQQAKLKYIAHTDYLTVHPFYWANFVVTGDTKPIKSIEYGSLGLLTCLAVMIAVFVFVLKFEDWFSKIK
jgi:CHAT domain-containing protein